MDDDIVGSENNGEPRDRQELFALEYLVDLNQTKAAIRAGYDEGSAHVTGSRLIRNAKVQEYISKELDERKSRLRVDADAVLNRYWQIATADYNELSSVRRRACEYCHFDDDEDEGSEKASSRNEINPDCVTCQGEGVPYVFIADTTKLSAIGNVLYEGAKQTKFGIEIITADKMKALDSVARHLGMFKDTINHVSEDGSMTPTEKPDYSKLTDDELRIYAALELKVTSNTSGASET